MIDTPVKYCTACKTTYPATTEYFYPSHLKKGGKNQCISCHSKGNHEIRPSKTNLLNRATEIQQDDSKGYHTIPFLAKKFGCTQGEVERNILQQDIPVFKFIYNGAGHVLAITNEDTEAYLKAVVEYNAANTSRHKMIGTPDLCGCCGNTRGNIIADLNEATHAKYGYLCARCHRLVRDFQGNEERIKKILAYLKKTRLH